MNINNTTGDSKLYNYRIICTSIKKQYTFALCQYLRQTFSIPRANNSNLQCWKFIGESFKRFSVDVSSTINTKVTVRDRKGKREREVIVDFKTAVSIGS